MARKHDTRSSSLRQTTSKSPAAAAKRRRPASNGSQGNHAARRTPAKPQPSVPRPGRTPETDPFRPPRKSTRVYCLHCGEKYDSYRIEWREFATRGGKTEGFWCCPTEGCGGKGFMIDIHPTTPGWEDDEDRGHSGGWFDDDGNPTDPPFADVPW